MEYQIASQKAAPRRAPLVVHVVRQFLPNRGGLEDVVRNICVESLKRGDRVRVVTLNSLFSAPDRILPATETIDGIDIVRIGWKGSSRYPLAPGVLAHIADADIVHVHAIDFFFDFLALTRIFHRKAMIATTHGGFFHTSRFAAIKKVWFRTLTAVSASCYRYVVGCSTSDTETFRAIAGDRVRMIENGVDTAKFADAASPVPVKRIITIGRFSVNKRLDRLIGTMASLVAGDPAWHLDIVGVPADLSATDLVGMIDAHGLAANVTLHLDEPVAAIRSLIGNCSFFASASEYEGFGLVAIEAMSAGLLPVLEGNQAYRSLAGRHADLKLADFTQPDAAAREFEATWQALAADGDLRSRLVATAAAYSWDGAASRYFDLYDAMTDLRVAA